MADLLVDHPLLILVVTFLAMCLFAAIGAILARRKVLVLRSRDGFGVVQGATLTLLALIIGFTFSMALGRYDQRKNLEEAEANAIGTEYVRADLLPARDAATVRALLQRYTEERVLYYVARDEQLATQAEARAVTLHNPLWAAVVAPAAAQPNPVMALVLAGMNDVLNSQGYTHAAWVNRIPFAAWALLAALALFSSLLVGFDVEHSNAGRVLGFVLPTSVSIACCLIADLESPRSGLIHVQPQNLLVLAQSLRGP